MNWAAWNASSSRLGGSGEGREKGEESDDKEEKGDRKRRLKDRLKFLENTLLSLILSQWGNIQDPWDDDNSTIKHFKLVCKVLHSKCNQFQQNLWGQSKITWQEAVGSQGVKVVTWQGAGGSQGVKMVTRREAASSQGVKVGHMHYKKGLLVVTSRGKWSHVQ